MTNQAPAPKRLTSQKRFRNKIVNVRFSDEEYCEVKERANRQGLSLAAYGRGSMLGGNPGQNSHRRPSEEKVALLRTLALLAHINHRVDEIARGMKQGDSRDVPDIRQILQDYADIRREILTVLYKSRELGLALLPTSLKQS